MTVESIELNSTPSSLEINHTEGTVSFMFGDHATEVIAIEAILEAAEILKNM